MTDASAAQEEGNGAAGPDELGMDTSLFEELEKDFAQVLKELAGNPGLEKFKGEYEKLHSALARSHDQEKKLIKKCRDLNTEILNNSSKVQTALKLSQEDQNTISSLKREIEKAWKMVDAAHDKELKAKETISQLKDEIANLSRLVEQGAGLSEDQEAMVKAVHTLREELAVATKESEDTRKKNDAMVRELQQHIASQDAQLKEREVEKTKLQEDLNHRKLDSERELRRRERVEKELRDLTKSLQQQATQCSEYKQKYEEAVSTKSELEAAMKESTAIQERLQREHDNVHKRAELLASELESRAQVINSLHAQKFQLESDLKLRQSEISKLKVDKGIAERKIEKEKQNTRKVEELVENEKTNKQSLIAEVTSLQKEIDRERKIETEQQKEISLLEREREIQVRKAQTAEDKTKLAVDEVKEHERIVKNLEAELDAFKREASKQRKLIYQLEKDREKSGLEATEQAQLYSETVELLKLKELKISELNSKLAEADAKMKQQQQLYEQVRGDRNVYSKNLVEAQDEIQELKKKIKIMNHQIEQLKDEIVVKDNALVKERFDHQKVEKQREQTAHELESVRKLLSVSDGAVMEQDAELKLLNNRLRRLEDELVSQKKAYDQVLSERDLLASQLIRRNDELALLYEKLRLHQSLLKKGEYQYQERLNDVRVLKIKVMELTRDVVLYRNQHGGTEEYKREIVRLQRELTEEKTKVKALSDEMENPLNVHRWRKLEGSDPATYELIQKVQTLQRRLIQKTEEVVEKELLLQEKQKMYTELKAILARQPGPEIAEQLTASQQQLKERTRQMKAMVSELNMAQAQVGEYKFENERLQQELKEEKRKFYEQKSKVKLLKVQAQPRSRQQPLKEEEEQEPQLAGNKFVGGGFSLKHA